MEPVNSRSCSPYEGKEVKGNRNKGSRGTRMRQKGNRCQLNGPSSECLASNVLDSLPHDTEDDVEPVNSRSCSPYEGKEVKSNMNKGHKCQRTSPSECSAFRMDDSQLFVTEDGIEPVNSIDSSVYKEQDMKNNMNKVNRGTSMRQKVNKRPWSGPEKDAVVQFCSDYIKKGVVPGKQACLEAIDESDGILAGRNWRHVKFAVKNILTSMRRRLN